VVVQVKHLGSDVVFFAVPLPEPPNRKKAAAFHQLLRSSFIVDYVKAMYISEGNYGLAVELPADTVTPGVAEGVIRGLVHLGDVGKNDLHDESGWESRRLECSFTHSRYIKLDPEQAREQVRQALTDAGLPVEGLGNQMTTEFKLGLPSAPGGLDLSALGELDLPPIKVNIRTTERVISFIAFFGDERPGHDLKYLTTLLELNRAANVAKAAIDKDGDVGILYEVPAILPTTMEEMRTQMSLVLLGIVAFRAGQ
jgi:hypothetical protein